MKTPQETYHEYVEAQFVEPTPSTTDRIAEVTLSIAELERQRDLYGMDSANAALVSEVNGELVQARAELSRLRNEQPKGGDATIPSYSHFDEHGNITSGPGSEYDRSGATPSPATSPEPQDVREATLEEVAQMIEGYEREGVGPDDLPAAIRALVQQAPDAAQPVGWQYREKAGNINHWIPGPWTTVSNKPEINTHYELRPLYTAPPRLDAVREALLEDGIRNLCYTAFQRRASGRNSDDGGECDWMNDTLPIIERGIKNLLASTPAPPASAELLEAAEWHEKRAREENALADELGGMQAIPVRTSASVHYQSAAYLRTRAADRSAPRSDKGGA